MRSKQELKQAMARIAISYVLIHIHFKLGNVDILPEWLGYLIIYNALPVISQKEKNARLLQPLALILLSVSLFQWLLSIFGRSISFVAIQLLAVVIALYFHFQLLTDLAHIMEQYAYPRCKQILYLRTVRTILTTVVYLPFSFIEEVYPQSVFLILFLIVIFWLCLTLRDMSRWLDDSQQQTENPS